MSSVTSKVRSSLSKRKKKLVSGDNRLADILSESSPDLNWQEILEEDVKYMTMLQIAAEITRENVESRTSRHKYLAHCAYLALVKIINLYFYVLDPGEECLDQDPTWTSSPEPPPAILDTLVGWSVPVLKDVVPVLKEPVQVLSHSSLLQRPVSLEDLPPFSLKPPDVPDEKPEECVPLVKLEESGTSTKLSESSIFIQKLAESAILDILNTKLSKRPTGVPKHTPLHHKMVQQSKMVMRQIEAKLKYVNPSLYPAPRVPVTYIVTPADPNKEEKQTKHKTQKVNVPITECLVHDYK